MLAALLAGARATPGLKPLTTARRDLFKVPLSATELGQFDAVTLDPPRAGALAQAAQLAKSKVSRIAYVSCNAESFARDARLLVDGGYAMGTVTPVDQFLWSEHIELVAQFARGRS
jgi:23S rRNA (uracil1939-C5)-methyltransferase